MCVCVSGRFCSPRRFFLSLFCLTISLIAFCCYCCFLSPNRSAHHFFCVCSYEIETLLFSLAGRFSVGENVPLCSCSSAAAALVSFDDWNGEGALSLHCLCATVLACLLLCVFIVRQYEAMPPSSSYPGVSWSQFRRQKYAANASAVVARN